MLVTRIVVGGTPVVVVNTHLLANYSGDWSPGNRFARHQREQLQRLVEVVNGVDRRLPLVIAGDFNVPRGAWLYDEFLHATALRDVLAGDDRPTFRQAMLMPGRYARPIDFVFVRPPAGSEIVASARLVFQEKTRLVTGRVDYLSDHYGVEAEIDVIRDP
jgi:endonuclease/exonuclease/phosphatase family metal-dependent hydrolase